MHHLVCLDLLIYWYPEKKKMLCSIYLYLTMLHRNIVFNTFSNYIDLRYVLVLNIINPPYWFENKSSWYNSSNPNFEQWFYLVMKSLLMMYYFLNKRHVLILGRDIWFDLTSICCWWIILMNLLLFCKSIGQKPTHVIVRYLFCQYLPKIIC
jgi:hypothetical protein